MFKDAISEIYQQSYTIEPTAYAKLNSDLTARQ